MHEAAHPSAMICFGMIPRVVRIDWPIKTLAGSTSLDLETFDPDDRNLRNLLVAVLAAPAIEGRLREDYPIIPVLWEHTCQDDAEKARYLVKRLGFDHVGWLQHVEKARRLTRNPRFLRLLRAIAHELEQREVLYQSDLAEIAGTIR
jgi:hypothetical protein